MVVASKERSNRGVASCVRGGKEAMVSGYEMTASPAKYGLSG